MAWYVSHSGEVDVDVCINMCSNGGSLADIGKRCHNIEHMLTQITKHELPWAAVGRLEPPRATLPALTFGWSDTMPSFANITGPERRRAKS